MCDMCDICPPGHVYWYWIHWVYEELLWLRLSESKLTAPPTSCHDNIHPCSYLTVEWRERKAKDGVEELDFDFLPAEYPQVS